MEKFSKYKDIKPMVPQMIYEAKKREHCIKVNQLNTNYSDMNNKDIPIVNPISCIEDASYSNISERERYQRLREDLLKERELIIRKPDYCNYILKEFLLRNGIYDDEYYQITYLNNLHQYLNSKLVIKPNKTLRDHIIEGLNFTREKDDEITTHCNKKNKMYSIRKAIQKKQLNDDNQESKTIKTNMELQKNLYGNKMLQTEIDFSKSPKDLVDLLKDDFNQEEHQNKQSQLKEDNRKKEQVYPIPNERLYKKQVIQNDFKNVKKNNKILEYICYVKAKNIIHFREIKDKLMIEDLNKPHSIVLKTK